MQQIGVMLRRLHSVPASVGPPPWLQDAIEAKDARNIYHCRYEDRAALLAVIPPGSAAAGHTRSIADFLDACAPAFSDSRHADLVHGDVHHGNLMWSGEVTALLDFEGTQAAPPDSELDTLLRQIWWPAVFGIEGVEHSEAERNELVTGLLYGYPDLFDRKTTNLRLVVYRTLMWLNEMHHFPASRATTVLHAPQITEAGAGRFRTALRTVNVTERLDAHH